MDLVQLQQQHFDPLSLYIISERIVSNKRDAKQLFIKEQLDAKFSKDPSVASGIEKSPIPSGLFPNLFYRVIKLRARFIVRDMTQLVMPFLSGSFNAPSSRTDHVHRHHLDRKMQILNGIFCNNYLLNTRLILV